jgi:hypothetical protein
VQWLAHLNAMQMPHSQVTGGWTCTVMALEGVVLQKKSNKEEVFHCIPGTSKGFLRIHVNTFHWAMIALTSIFQAIVYPLPHLLYSPLIPHPKYIWVKLLYVAPYVNRNNSNDNYCKRGAFFKQGKHYIEDFIWTLPLPNAQGRVVQQKKKPYWDRTLSLFFAMGFFIVRV